MSLRECNLVMERPRTRSSGSRDKRHSSEISLTRKRARLSVGGQDQPMAEANGGCSGGQARDKLGSRGWVDRYEFVRLLQQGLHSLGYADVAGRLEQVRAGIDDDDDDRHHWDGCMKPVEC